MLHLFEGIISIFITMIKITYNPLRLKKGCFHTLGHYYPLYWMLGQRCSGFLKVVWINITVSRISLLVAFSKAVKSSLASEGSHWTGIVL